MFIIRALPVAFGLHTLAAILLLFAVLTRTTRVLPSRIIISIFSSMVVLVILEFAIYQLFLNITGLDFQTVQSDYLLWTLVSLPQAVILIIFALLVAKYKKPVPGMWKI